MKNGIILSGKLRLDVLDKHGVITRTVRMKNLIVNTSLAQVIKFIGGDTASILITHLAIGTDGSTQSASDTALGAEVKRTAVVKTYPSAMMVEFKANWGIGAATGKYKEAGMFSAASGGVLFNRTTFQELEIEADSQLIATWSITIAAEET